MNDVENEFKRDILIYTNTLEFGVDFNIEWFDKAYFFGANSSCGAFGLAQMIHRVRKLKDELITLCFVGTGNQPIENYSSEIIEHFFTFHAFCHKHACLNNISYSNVNNRINYKTRKAVYPSFKIIWSLVI